MALKIKPKTKIPAPQATQIVDQLEKGQVIATSEEHPEIGFSQGEPLEPIKPWCQVGYEVGYTHNLGDFKSTRATVSIVLPCEAEEVNDTFDYARSWAEEKLNLFIQEVTGGEE